MSDYKSLHGRRVYIAGRITGDPHYKEKFWEADYLLQRAGALVMNPAVLPEGFPYESYLPICFKMLDACDAIYLLPDWQESSGAAREYRRAAEREMEIIYG